METKTMVKIKMIMAMLLMVMMVFVGDAADTNSVYDPCSDAKIRRLDGNNAQLAVFRPKVDEMSLLTINSSTFSPIKAGGYMVAFAGRKYAARSLPTLVADDSNTITSFTLVLEFQRGTLQNLYWKKFGCKACSGDYSVCLNNEDCAVPNSKCKSSGGSFDCNLSIQLAFSGTDKHLQVLNSWYEVKNLRSYSLYGLFSKLLQ
ncbi:uncharacterized protein LOC110765977 isoform X2 [Prunus avium]|uniref:Uncharacterized protein LOC110765977 isoform X2 n=1 Tax=Prunus avium TaxID=42229 RepID=A0A6P5TCZ0_PRUAV|nr:uncharacterized protein LOC110765977 isoform X2 [Prunus avium]